MSPNVRSLDRIVRVVLGIALLSLVFVGPHTLWGLVGIVPLATGVSGICPLYRLFGVSTCSNASTSLGGHAPPHA